MRIAQNGLLTAVFAVAAAGIIGARAVGTAHVGALPNATLDSHKAPGGKGTETAVFAGGCFWGIQAVYERVKGVVSATSGFAGGDVSKPSYELVSTGTTGHAESVRVVYDPSVVTYGQLLKVFFASHDPTELNRQGPDEGTQYRSAIFYTTPEQEQVAKAYIDQLNKAKAFSRPIVTQLSAFKSFWPAEDYHQQYFDHHPNEPYIVINDAPKVANLKKEFPELYTPFMGK